MALGSTLNGQSVQTLRGLGPSESKLQKIATSGSPWGMSPDESTMLSWDAQRLPEAQQVAGGTKLIENVNAHWGKATSQPVTPAQIPQQQQSEQPQ
jgi:hypothetical protein